MAVDARVQTLTISLARRLLAATDLVKPSASLNDGEVDHVTGRLRDK
jgi:hypothetical protein